MTMKEIKGRLRQLSLQNSFSREEQQSPRQHGLATQDQSWAEAMQHWHKQVPWTERAFHASHGKLVISVSKRRRRMHATSKPALSKPQRANSRGQHLCPNAILYNTNTTVATLYNK